jgi:hypothetical protein
MWLMASLVQNLYNNTNHFHHLLWSGWFFNDFLSYVFVFCAEGLDASGRLIARWVFLFRWNDRTIFGRLPYYLPVLGTFYTTIPYELRIFALNPYIARACTFRDYTWISFPFIVCSPVSISWHTSFQDHINSSMSYFCCKCEEYQIIYAKHRDSYAKLNLSE